MGVTLEQLYALRDKLKAATGPSRELDAEIWDAFDPLKQTRWPFAEGSYNGTKTPAVSGSIDASEALRQRVLPELDYSIEYIDGLDGGPYCVGTWVKGRRDETVRYTFGKKEPLARTLAVVEAAIAIQEAG